MKLRMIILSITHQGAKGIDKKQEVSNEKGCLVVPYYDGIARRMSN
jgi:hypothetical protein